LVAPPTDILRVSLSPLKNLCPLLLLAAVAVGTPLVAGADALHAGAANPLSEGWTVESGDTGTASPVSPDPDYPDVTAWEVATSVNDRLRYRVDPPPPGSVWSLRARLRVVDVGDSPDFNVLIEVADGTRRWLVGFGSQADGDTQVEVQGGVSVTVPTGSPGLTDYIWIELSSDPATGSVDVFVDGSEIQTGWMGSATSLSRVNFGDGQSSASGRARYARVELSIGPHECADGLDNDGDGAVDLAGGDPDCVSSNDPSEDQPDHDGDGLLDGFEIANGFDPDDPDENANLVLDGEEDTDGDGATNVEEQAAATDPNDVDTDDDGLTDGLELASSGFGPPRLLPTAFGFDWIPEVEPSDLDGDGDPDLLSLEQLDDNVWWHENTDGAGGFGPEIAIQTATPETPISVKAADLDGDGDPDVMAVWQGTRIGWWENLGGGSFGALQVVTNGFGGPNSFASALHMADLDGDGDIDVVAAAAEDLVWLENTNGAGSFVVNPIGTTVLALTELSVVDVDGDGDPDILVLAGNPLLGWHENIDGLGTFTAIQVIDPTLSTLRTDIDAADFDGDDDIDLLQGSTNSIAWYEGERGLGFGERQLISSSGSSSLRVANVDGDADPDFISGVGDRIDWFENTDGNGGFVRRPVAEGYADGIFDLDVADFDGDGDPDVVASAFDLTSLSNRADKIVWFENRSLTDPLDADSDGDGLCDGGGPTATAPECALGGEDTNGNGVYDVGVETSPRDFDTDDDGFGDGEEVARGSDPLDPGSTPVVAVPAVSETGRVVLGIALGASAMLAGRRRFTSMRDEREARRERVRG